MDRITGTTIEADPRLPVIRTTRDFAAPPGRLFRAHTDPAWFARWIGPDALSTRIEHWDATTGGSWRYVSSGEGREYAFRGCFHEVREERIVQTFSYAGNPDAVLLVTTWFDDLGGGRSRLRTQSLVDSFEARDAWLRSGMEVGLDQGYAKLERMATDDAA
ncbi:SRPBCC family protein [Amorphoplanes nipponensis]|uniref:Activator of HSP90 ATPase n=1 Tax=Actinoplanes nipponensis TaxID=135950 RepID=A0A919JJL1_9ACTN|nr:SRPBCC family protein [Actinoplanes nipponensis]GIE47964.1 activator of HSP90 ATPase [Actinoplanes nipponensis]